MCVLYFCGFVVFHYDFLYYVVYLLFLFYIYIYRERFILIYIEIFAY